MEQRDREEITRTMQAHPASRGLVFNVAVTVLEIGGAIAVFGLVQARGGSDVEAYLAGTAAPLAGAVIIWARARKLSGASVAIFAFALLSAAVALVGSTDPKVLLSRDCATTALVGAVLGLSCFVVPRPVMSYFSQRYGTDGTREGMAAFDAMWVAYPTFRRTMYLISAVWAVVFLVQAGVTALIIAATPFAQAYVRDQVLPALALALAIALTVVISRRAQRAGRAAEAARA